MTQEKIVVQQERLEKAVNVITNALERENITHLEAAMAMHLVLKHLEETKGVSVGIKVNPEVLQ